MTAPRGIRNNNPGNLEYHADIPWRGQTGSDGRFAVFDTAHNGIRALAKQLIVYTEKYGLTTINGAIHRWAPPSENDSGAYVRAVADALNVDPDEPLDWTQPTILANFVAAIIRHENGQQPYEPGLIRAAVWDALGMTGEQPVPVEDRPQQPVSLPESPMFPALFIPLLTSLAGAFAPALQQKISSALGVKDPAMASTMTTQLLDIVKGVAAGSLPPQTTPESPTPVPVDPARIDPVVAVGMVKADPKLLQQAEMQIADRLALIMPVVDRIDAMERAAFQDTEDSRDRAAARAKVDGTDMGGPLIAAMLASLGFLIVFICGVAAWQVYKNNGPSLEVWAAITGMIGFVTGVAGTIYAYRFGSSRSSSAKDTLIAETVRSRQ
jgi:hypothetical protein